MDFSLLFNGGGRAGVGVTTKRYIMIHSAIRFIGVNYNT